MLPTQNQQLALNVNLRDGYRFKSFYTASKSKNIEIIGILRHFILSKEPQQNILWGESSSGKTHLLQACCAKEVETQPSLIYIPLGSSAIYGTEIFSGLSHYPLIVLDDIDTIIGDKQWEIALFNLINTCRDKQRLLMSSSTNPRQLDCALPDLASRLIWGGSYQLHILSDKDKPRALQTRAEQRGFKLNDQVIDYLYRRYPRDIKSLMNILDKLDKESLRKKSMITIPFVREVLKVS